MTEQIFQELAPSYPIPNEGQSLPPFQAGQVALRRITINLTNARDQVEIKIGGNFLWMADASLSSASLSIGLSREQGSDAIPYKIGTAIKGAKFQSIFVTNTAQSDVTAVFIYMYNPLDDGIMSVTNAGIAIATVSLTRATTALGVADPAALANNTGATLVADATIRRRFVQADENNTFSIRVGPAAAAGRGALIMPGQTINFNGTFAVTIFNDATGANQIYRSWSEND